jgi:hypothetical protein
MSNHPINSIRPAIQIEAIGEAVAKVEVQVPAVKAILIVVKVKVALEEAVVEVTVGIGAVVAVRVTAAEADVQTIAVTQTVTVVARGNVIIETQENDPVVEKALRFLVVKNDEEPNSIPIMRASLNLMIICIIQMIAPHVNAQSEAERQVPAQFMIKNVCINIEPAISLIMMMEIKEVEVIANQLIVRLAHILHQELKINMNLENVDQMIGKINQVVFRNQSVNNI